MTDRPIIQSCMTCDKGRTFAGVWVTSGYCRYHGLEALVENGLLMWWEWPELTVRRFLRRAFAPFAWLRKLLPILLLLGCAPHRRTVFVLPDGTRIIKANGAAILEDCGESRCCIERLKKTITFWNWTPECIVHEFCHYYATTQTADKFCEDFVHVEDDRIKGGSAMTVSDEMDKLAREILAGRVAVAGAVAVEEKR